MRILNKDLRLQDVTIMYLTVLATLVVILVASYQAASPPGLPTPAAAPHLAYHMPLDPRGELQLAWNVSYAQQEVLLELRVARPGYGLVLGMSDRGEITNADLVVLWDDGKQSYFGVRTRCALYFGGGRGKERGCYFGVTRRGGSVY